MSLFSEAELAIFGSPKDPNHRPDTQGVANLFKKVPAAYATRAAAAEAVVSDGDYIAVQGLSLVKDGTGTALLDQGVTGFSPASTAIARAFGAMGAYDIPTATGADDTGALQRAFAWALSTGNPVELEGRTYRVTETIATVTGGLRVYGSGAVIVMDNSGGDKPAIFKVGDTFGLLSEFYPDSVGDDAHVLDYSHGGRGIWSDVMLLAHTRENLAFGFDFDERNEMMEFRNVDVCNMRGSAVRLTGAQGNLREVDFNGLTVRMCGSADYPAVDLAMPSLENTGVTVTGTSVTLTGTGANFSALTGSDLRIRVQGAGGTNFAQELSIASIDTDTTATLTTAPNNNVTGQACSFYAHVDGLNHVVMRGGQLVGCFGTYLRISSTRGSKSRRVVLQDMMFHGAKDKADGDAGDMIVIEGRVASVTGTIRINGAEAGMAGVRVRAHPVMTDDVPDWVGLQIDGQNFDDGSEGLIVIEGIGSGRITGAMNTSTSGGTELKVTSGAISGFLEYDVAPAGTLTSRNVDAFDIHADQVALVGQSYTHTPEITPVFKSLRLGDPDQPSQPMAGIAYIGDDAPTASIATRYSDLHRNVNSVRSPSKWHVTNDANFAPYQMAQEASAGQVRSVTDNANANMPTRGYRILDYSSGRDLHKSVATAEGAWYTHDGQISIIPAIKIGGGTWTESASGTGEYYRTGVSDVSQVIEGDCFGLTEGTLGSLGVGQWAVGDNDSIGASALYVRPYHPATAPGSMSDHELRYRTVAHGAVTATRITDARGTAAPTAGYYRTGDYVRNTVLTGSLGETTGWRCIADGWPGVWAEEYRGPKTVYVVDQAAYDLLTPTDGVLYLVGEGA